MGKKFSVGNKLKNRILSLPIDENLKTYEVDMVIKNINTFFNDSSLCNLCNQKHKKKLVKLPMSKFIVGDGSKIVNAKKNYYFCLIQIFLLRMQILVEKILKKFIKTIN